MDYLAAYAVGAARAIPRKRLASALGLDTRTLEQTVQAARRDGEPIGSSTGRIPGYYLVADVRELDRAIAALERRRNQCSLTIAEMRRSRKRVGQRHLFAIQG